MRSPNVAPFSYPCRPNVPLKTPPPPTCEIKLAMPLDIRVSYRKLTLKLSFCCEPMKTEDAKFRSNPVSLSKSAK